MTVALPSPLAQWSEYLGLLRAPLDLAIGRMVQRLDRAVGPVDSFSFSHSDEPDGYDGIARKGSYERLLMSEWVLADEFPDEFLRRTISHEQSFIELARLSPSGERRMLVIIDAGPRSSWMQYSLLRALMYHTSLDVCWYASNPTLLERPPQS